MAAHHLHAGISDETAHTAPTRAAFLARFEREVDPGGVLEPSERARRAEHARKAYFLRLALASAHARAARRGGGPSRAADPWETPGSAADPDGATATERNARPSI